MSPPAHEDDGPVRILCVFAWLVVGGEETELRHLVRRLDPARYRLDVVACFRRENMPEQTHAQLEALGVHVDRTPYTLSFEDTVSYLAGRLPDYDLVVGFQAVPDLYPALERYTRPPPLIEHGGLVSEALAGPKHHTARYVGVCHSIAEAAAARMPGREQDAIEIPSMVDLAEFRPADRAATRRAWGVGEATPVVGWVGRLDRKKRVEDFIRAAALVRATHPTARFVVIGGPDAFMPEYETELRSLAASLKLGDALAFLGDRPDVPALLAGLDVFVWLSRGEGMPHVVAEAGAAGLPVVATADNGTLEQIEDGVTGLFVPHESPGAVAAAIGRLLDDPALRARLGTALQAKVRDSYAVEAVVPQWQALFDGVLAGRRSAAVPRPALFRSFFQGGFEASTHRREDGRRLDLIAAIGHDRLAEADYRTLARHGIRTVRDGVRWHLVEAVPGRQDWSSLLPMLRAARDTGTQVIWDLLHYGWPDDLDIWSHAFPERFARFAAATARVVRDETDAVPFYCPVNEMSFFAWGGGDVAYLNPFARGRGFELKVQLARCSILAMDAILAVEPRARFVHAEPVINVIGDVAFSPDLAGAEGHRQAQFEAWDLVSGRRWPQLGGRPEHLDVIGVNYYFNNQWIHGGPPIDQDHAAYRPFRRFLIETHARYGRPIFISETGIEAERRPDWLAYIGAEVRAAMRAGVPVEGICLYPIADHPGWDDDRDCPNGLLASAGTEAGRPAYEPLARELRRQQALFAAMLGTAPALTEASSALHS